MRVKTCYIAFSWHTPTTTHKSDMFRAWTTSQPCSWYTSRMKKRCFGPSSILWIVRTGDAYTSKSWQNFMNFLVELKTKYKPNFKMFMSTCLTMILRWQLRFHPCSLLYISTKSITITPCASSSHLSSMESRLYSECYTGWSRWSKNKSCRKRNMSS